LLQRVTHNIMLLCTVNAGAQKAASIDLAYIRNIRHQLNGLNVSSFYHFNERLIGGIEMNRFFPVSRVIEDERIESSAWDFDLNFHYLLPLGKTVKLYPLSGISHTSEKEHNRNSGEIIYERFWSFNTGAGVLFSLGKWSPHIEYMFTWGHLNQQFLLAGISYEVEWGKKEKK
jgi:hypothetical protein